MPEWGGNHDGGYVHVAHDGTLFVSVGDGGAGRPDDQPGRPQPAQRQDPADQHRRLASRPATPTARTVCGTTWGDAGHDVRRDLRRRPAQPVPPGLQGRRPGREFRINDVGDATWEEVDEGDRRRPLRLAVPGRARRPRRAALPCNTPVHRPDALVQPLDRLQRDHGRRVRARRRVAGLRRRLPLRRQRLRQHVRRPARHDGRRLADRWPPASTASPTWRSSSRTAPTRSSTRRTPAAVSSTR